MFFVLESYSMTPLLILASGSPRRRQLLSLTGWSFGIRPADIDETPLVNEAPAAYVTRLASSKARAVGRLSEGGAVILASDTTVADGARILGKPASAAEAREVLVSLRGRSHQVLTAIAGLERDSNQLVTDLCVTQVWMRDYTDAEIEEYIATGDPFDKAGAYAIQHAAFHPVERLEGCYGCLMGMSVCQVTRLLRPFGLKSSRDFVQECKKMLTYDCQVYQELAGKGSVPGVEKRTS